MNIVVFGVGHSGTSIVTAMLHELGWKRNRADERFREIPAFRRLNEEALRTGELPDGAEEFVRALEVPWVLKDPRLVMTLPLWKPLLDPYRTLLLCLDRERDALMESYRRRPPRLPDGRLGMYGRTVDELARLAARAMADWDGPKTDLCYEYLARACALFRTSGTPAVEGGVWRETPPPR